MRRVTSIKLWVGRHFKAGGPVFVSPLFLASWVAAAIDRDGHVARVKLT